MAQKKFGVDVNFGKNEAVEMRLENLGAHPVPLTPGNDTVGHAGYTYYNYNDKKVYVYTGIGTDWLDLSKVDVNLSSIHNINDVVIDNAAGDNAIISGATITKAGVMTASDKTKLDSISAGANIYAGWTLQAKNSIGQSLGTSLIDNNDSAVFKSGTGISLSWGDDEITITNSSPNLVTNLTLGYSTTTITITSDGNAVILNAATQALAGVMSAIDKTKLDSIETNADATDSDNVSAAGAVMFSGTSTSGMNFVIDEDDMISDSDVKVPTQQSVKAYVDAVVSSSTSYKGSYDALNDVPKLEVTPVSTSLGDQYVVTVSGTFFTVDVKIGTILIAEKDSAVLESDWTIIQSNNSGNVVGPNSAINNNVAIFNGTSGKLIKDSGVSISGINTGNEVQATETLKGIAEIATSGEAISGTDDLRIVTPKKLQTKLNSYRYAVDIGNGTQTDFTISQNTHNLGEVQDLEVIVRQISDGSTIICEDLVTSSGLVTLKFNTAPTTNQYRIIIRRIY